MLLRAPEVIRQAFDLLFKLIPHVLLGIRLLPLKFFAGHIFFPEARQFAYLVLQLLCGCRVFGGQPQHVRLARGRLLLEGLHLFCEGEDLVGERFVFLGHFFELEGFCSQFLLERADALILGLYLALVILDEFVFVLDLLLVEGDGLIQLLSC